MLFLLNILFMKPCLPAGFCFSLSSAILGFFTSVSFFAFFSFSSFSFFEILSGFTIVNLGCFSFSDTAKTMVMWLLFFWIRFARPMALGMYLLTIAPLSQLIFLTKSCSGFNWALFLEQLFVKKIS